MAIDKSADEDAGTGGFGGHQFTGLMFGGWLRDVPDRRDRPLFPRVGSFDVEGAEQAPEGLDPTDPDQDAVVEVGGWDRPVLQQKPLQSCVSCAVAAVVGHLDGATDDPGWSTLFLYYNAREADRTGRCDNGSTLRGALKGLNRHGVCTDDAWGPAQQFVERPTASAYENAFYAGNVSYRRIFRLGTQPDDLDLMPVRRALANGLPVLFGFSVFDSFRTAGGGAQVPLPGPRERVLFGHAAVLLAHDGRSDTWTAVNSWGQEWGRDGRFVLPGAYLRDSRLAQDFWVITSLDGSVAATPRSTRQEATAT